jgi:type III secretion system low calcium response chaperone LcrH/SycD
MSDTIPAENPASPTPDEIIQAVAAKGMEVLMQGGNLYTLRGMTEQDIEAIYYLGHNHYSVGSYADAEKIFQGLCLLNHLGRKNWIALGAAQQMQKKYEPAMTSYGYAQALDIEEATPTMHIYECLMSLENYPRALDALEGVLKITQGIDSQKTIRAKAEALHKALREAMDRAGA